MRCFGGGGKNQEPRAKNQEPRPRFPIAIGIGASRRWRDTLKSPPHQAENLQRKFDDVKN